MFSLSVSFFFFFNDTATTEIYTLSLHDALPIWRITESPTGTTARPAGTVPQAGEVIERFEVVGNTTVASDTIRVYLGVNPGDPYNPDALQKNFLNLWQTGLFDDIKLESDRG